MSNASEEEEGNLLRSVKTFYTRGSLKSVSQKQDGYSATTPDKSAACEVISPARAKRRRIQSTRYSGFVTHSTTRNEQTAPKLSSRNSPSGSPLSCATDATNSPSKCQKQQEVSENLELVEPEIFTARQKRTLTVPLHRMVEYHDQVTFTETLAVQKIAEAAQLSENSSSRECGEARKLSSADVSFGKSTTPSSSIEMPPTPAKLKRKQALCAIFEDIWNEKKSDVAEKPQINGFKQMFNDIFNKVPHFSAHNAESTPRKDLSKTTHIPSLATDDNHRQIITREVFSGKKNVSKPTQVSLNHPKTLSIAVDCSPPSELIISDLSGSSQVEVETLRSARSSSLPDNEDNFPPACWLHSAQSKCTAQSKLVSPQLIIRKTVLPTAMRTEHRKKRRRRRRKRKTPSQVTDADDEHSDSRPSFPHPRSPLTGPLKLMTLEDLWIQKEFYLRYLCNYYHMSSEGCKGWMISRLHQFILQNVGSSSLLKHKTLKSFRAPLQRSERSVSWVRLNVEFKTNLLNE